MIKVGSTITVVLNETEHKLSVDEARELHTLLGHILGTYKEATPPNNPWGLGTGVRPWQYPDIHGPTWVVDPQSLPVYNMFVSHTAAPTP